MLTVLFIVGMIGIFGRLLGFAFQMTWGIVKVLLTLVFLPILLIVMVIGGLIYIALPILAVIGIISLVASFDRESSL